MYFYNISCHCLFLRYLLNLQVFDEALQKSLPLCPPVPPNLGNMFAFYWRIMCSDLCEPLTLENILSNVTFSLFYIMIQWNPSNSNPANQKFWEIWTSFKKTCSLKIKSEFGPKNRKSNENGLNTLVRFELHANDHK